MSRGTRRMGAENPGNRWRTTPVLSCASFATLLLLYGGAELQKTPTSVGSRTAISSLDRRCTAEAAHPPPKPGPVPTFDNSSLENLRSDRRPWLCTSRERLGPFELADLAGRKWTDRELRGKVVIAVLWATWCGPCKGELAAVETLYEKTRQDRQIAVVTLNLDDDPARVAPFVQQHRYDFPVLLARSIFKEFPGGVPVNWLVDREGFIRKEVCGYTPGLLDVLQRDAVALKRGEPLTPDFERK